MAIQRTYKEDEIILTEGNFNKHIYMVIEGQAALYMNYGKSDEYLIGICGSNKIFGEVSALSETEATYTAVAFSDIKLAILSLDELESFLKSNPEQSLTIIRSLTRYNQILSLNCKQLLTELNNTARNTALRKDINKYTMGINVTEILNRYRINL